MPNFNTMTEEERQQFVIDLKEGRDADMTALRAECQAQIAAANLKLQEAITAKTAMEVEFAVVQGALTTANAENDELKDQLEPARVAERARKAGLKASALAKMVNAGVSVEEAAAAGVILK